MKRLACAAAPRTVTAMPVTPSARRGFTLVELVVVIAVIGLLAAFVVPRLVGNESMAADQQAQTTASGALDTVVDVYLHAGTSAAAACDGVTHTVMDSSVTPAVPVPLSDSRYDGIATNDVVVANPCSLAAANGDVRFLPGTVASPSAEVASVSAMRVVTNGQRAWKVGVAVLAPAHKQSVSSCWIVTRTLFDDGAMSGASNEAYFLHTNLGTGDATGCTGEVALGYSLDGEDRFCAEHTLGAVPDPLGGSWRKPCPDYVS